MAVCLLLGLALFSPAAEAGPQKAALVIDAQTGRTLYEESADAQCHPASLTKAMTLYMLFREIEAGRMTLDTVIRMSPHAASREPSKLYIKAGQGITAEAAIMALVTKSANDVAAAIGEHISGSEARFGRAMTDVAQRELGMTRTVFRNASGLPDSRQVTTARDMVRLAYRLQVDFPQYYGYFSAQKFHWNDRVIGNHNHLLYRYKGTTGLKTGFIRASGYNLTATVERDGRRLIGVVMGGRTGRARDDRMIEILNIGMNRATPGKQIMTRFGPITVPGVPREGGVPAPSQLLAQATATTFHAMPATQGAPARKPVAVAKAEPTPKTSQPGTTQQLATRYSGSSPFANPYAAKTPSSDGWHIQIGAFTSSKAAYDHLKTATDIAPTELSSAVPYALPVDLNGKKLYRSRFKGFNSEVGANLACTKLKAANMSCIAIPPAYGPLSEAPSNPRS